MVIVLFEMIFIRRIFMHEYQDRFAILESINILMNRIGCGEQI